LNHSKFKGCGTIGKDLDGTIYTPLFHTRDPTTAGDIQRFRSTRGDATRDL